MENNKVCLVDVDGTVALTHDQWFKRYNAEWSDDLTYEEITDWEVHSFVKESCGKSIYKYLDDPTLYDEVQPYPGSIEGVEKLRNYGFRVVFLSSGVHPGKIKFLRKFDFIGKGDSDFVIAHDKSLIKGFILIDDGWHNIQAFNGPGILLDAPHNRKVDYNFRAMDWDHVVKLVGTFEVADQLINSMRM
jgi:5'(3')-deoxyribonucleotidase